MTTYYKTTEHLRSTIDDREWIVPPPAEIRQYPRSPYEAVLHAIEYLDSPFIAPVPWKGRGMTAVARCYGLQTAETGRIPATIPGPRYSAIRQFRWLMQTYPEYAVPAPNPYTFGADVPMGAVVYWDESSPSGGGVGIAAGYREGLLQILMVTNDPTKNWGLSDTVPYGCAGWSLPIFYTHSSFDTWSLWDGDDKTVSSRYDGAEVAVDPVVYAYDNDFIYDISRFSREEIWL